MWPISQRGDGQGKRDGQRVKTAGDHRRGGIARAIWSLMFIAILLVAPLLISATHGPGAYAQALDVVAADLAHGHSHDLDENGSPQHDATDHEHQTVGLLEDQGHPDSDAATTDLHATTRLEVGGQRDGPRRPPRV